MNDLMKAVRLHAFGGPEMLKYENAPKPELDRGEVLVRVHAIGVNPPDWYLRDGYRTLPPEWRPAGDFPIIPGTDISGTVAAVAGDVGGFKVGDEVYSMVRFPEGVFGSSKAYAEYVNVPATQLGHKPRGIDHVHAAAAPMSLFTAWQFLIDLGHDEPNPVMPNQHHPVPLAGKTVMVNGAAGGVGHFAVQIAKWKGAHVIAVASAKHEKMLMNLGVDMFIDYRTTTPEDLRDQTLRTDRVQQVFGLGSGRVRIGGHIVSPESLFDFLRATFDGRTVPMMDVEGVEVASSGDWDASTGVVVKGADGSVTLDFAGLLHDDPAIRLATFRRLCINTTLPHRDVSEWSNKIAGTPISMDELKSLLGAFRTAPERWLQDFRGKVGDLTLSDLQANERAYYEAFFQLGAGLPLSQALGQAVERRAEQGNVAHVAFLIAPLAIATDFDIKALVAGLADKEAAELASELAQAGDLFSAIAALQIVSSRLGSDDCVKVGTEVLDAYLGTSERMAEAAHDFVALAKSVIGSADINGTLSDAPIANRRCALLAHAGLLTREFSKLEVKRPKFLEMVERWIGNSYRVASLVERSSERWWVRERLHPLVIAAQVRMRLRNIIRSIPEADRPAAWSVYVASDGVEVPDIVEFSAGPLDEYSSNWQTQTFPSAELASAMDSGNIVGDQNALFNALLAFEQPSDLGVSRDSVIALLERSTDDAFAQSVELALTAAARWKDKLLAERTFALAFERKAGGKWTYRSFAELAVASAASSTDAAEYAAALEKNLRTLVERRLAPSEAQDMVGILDELQDLMPDLACLPTLRSAALLAS
ncbi:NADP-dependent oxidoreductase [Sphingobium sp. CECT 9361]|uniref:NADP-dependent oxidoreductase n=1 Tax=Sphingobium sp. CECT 9361 TaxID=2845384 RepID=UPI001E49F8F9|nr:NADP-dependent oxidoreductase [Sphingobium sp. CECT 9361]